MPPLNRRRLAAKRRMKALRLRYPNGLWNKPVEPVKEIVEEEPIGVEETFEGPEISQVQTEDEVQTGLVEENLEETQETEWIETVPEELVDDTIEEIQIVQVGETYEETSSVVIGFETAEEQYEVPETFDFTYDQ